MQNTTKTTKIPRVAFHLDSSNVSSNNGGSHVYLRVRIDGKYCYFPTQIYVVPEHWDKTTKKVRHVKGHRNSIEKEQQMDAVMATMRTAIADLIRAGRPLTERSLKNRWGLKSQETFKEFAHHILSRKKHLNHGTLKNYRNAIEKANRFDPGITLNRMTSEWIQDFTEWLRVEGSAQGGPMKHNSVVFYLRNTRTFLKIARKAGLIQHDPFEDLTDRPRMKKSKREFLSEEEIDRLHQMYIRGDFLKKEIYKEVFPNIQKPSAYHNLLQAYLVSVYTGLRLSDVRRVNQFLVGDHIYLSMQKTSDPIRIKVIDRLKEIMFSPVKILNAGVPWNATVGHHLKIVLKVAGIQRHLSFHSARHTFATTLLAKGVDLKTVSKLLGHRDIATTDIYTHITDKQREDGISKLDQLGTAEAPLKEIKAILAKYPYLIYNEEFRKLVQTDKPPVIHRVS